MGDKTDLQSAEGEEKPKRVRRNECQSKIRGEVYEQRGNEDWSPAEAVRHTADETRGDRLAVESRDWHQSK